MINTDAVKAKLLEALELLDIDAIRSQPPSQRKVWEISVWEKVEGALDYNQDIIEGKHEIRYWPSGLAVMPGRAA